MDNTTTGTGPSSQLVQPITPMNTANQINKNKKGSPFKSILVCGCLFLCLLIVVGGSVLALTNTDVKAYIASIVPVNKYQEANSTAELNKFVKDGYSDIVRSVDLTKLNKDNPIDVLPKDQLVKITRENEKLNKLADYNFNPSGKTIQLALDGNYSYSTSISNTSASASAAQSMKVNFISDLYITYPNYDYSKFNNKDIKKYSEFLNSLTLSEVDKFMPKFNIVGNIDLTQGTDNVKGKFDITFADKAIYVKFTDLQMPDSAKSNKNFQDLILTEGKVMKINIQQSYDAFVTAYLDNLHQNLKVYNSWDDFLKDFNDKLKQYISKLKDSDIQMIQRVGNPIRDIIADTISNTNILINITNVSPIRDTSDSICSQGDVDFNTILYNVNSAEKKIYNVIKNDPGYTGQKDDQKVNNDIDNNFAKAKKFLTDANLLLKISTCTSKSQNYFTGFGIDLGFTRKDVFLGDSSGAFKFNILVVDWNSSKTVVTPKEDVDITDQIIPTLMPSTLPQQTTPLPMYGYPTLPLEN